MNDMFKRFDINLELDFTLKIFGFEEDFYWFKRNLRALDKRGQLLNIMIISLNKNDSYIFFSNIIDFNNPISLQINKKNIKSLNYNFERTLKNSKFKMLVIWFKEKSITFIGTMDHIKERFEELTGLNLVENIKKCEDYVLKRVEKIRK